MDKSKCIEKIIEKINKLLISKISPNLIVLFGSAVKGRFREDSDIDVAFLASKEISEYDIFILGQELAEQVGREVDLVDLKKASTVFKTQILGKGKVIYSDNTTKVKEFKIRAFKEYCLLNEERKVILDNIKERGNIYGG